MDLNLVVLCGRLAAEPETRLFDSGASLLRLLVTIKTTSPRQRVDVIPVVYWDPPRHVFDEPLTAGSRIWVCGSVQRRYWDSIDGRTSRIEIVAEQITLEKDSADVSRQWVNDSLDSYPVTDPET